MIQFEYSCFFTKEKMMTLAITGTIRFRFQECGLEEVFFDNIFNDFSQSDILWIVDDEKYTFIERLTQKNPNVKVATMDELIAGHIIPDFQVIVSDEESLYGSSLYSLLEINNYLDKCKRKNVLVVLDNIMESPISTNYHTPELIAKHINERSRNINCKNWDKSFYYIELFQVNNKLYALPLIVKKSSKIRMNLNDIKELGFIVEKNSRIYLTSNPLDTSIAILE